MHKNFIWQAFLCFVLVVTLYYSGVAMYRYHIYTHLTAQATASNAIHWTVQQHANDDFFLQAEYIFKVGDKAYQGTTAWPNEHYLNRWAAEQAIADFSLQHQDVWYDPADPAYSSLQKDFPFKECLSAFVLWGLLLYFFWLGYYVAKFKT